MQIVHLYQFYGIRNVLFGTFCSSEEIILISSTWRRSRCSNYSVTWRSYGGARRFNVFARPPLLSLIEILNVETVFCCDIGKWRGPQKKGRTSRSCWGEKTKSYCTKIIKRWWTSLEVGFCSGFLREASIEIRHTKDLEIFLSGTD